MLLIVTSKSDIGSDFIVHRLRQRNLEFARLNTDEYLDRFDVRLNVGVSSRDFAIRFDDGRVIGPGDVTGVVFRRPVVPGRNATIANEDAEFVEREQLEALRSLWRALPRDRWLSHPDELWRARNKYEQLTRAAEVGFTIPETVITADPDDVREFGAKVGWPIVAKAVKHGFVCRGLTARLGLTRRFDEGDLGELSNSALSPLIFQQLVPKVVDIRATVVGEKVFCASIASQSHPATAIDWRAMNAISGCDLLHLDHVLPASLMHQCVGLTRSYGLKFSAIDLALKDDGEYVFFEMNPNGEWVWIEERVGHPISHAIFDLLLGAGGCV